MTDLAAGMGLAQMRKAEAMWRRRCAIARRYHDALRRNMLIEQPELVPDKLERVRTLVRLGYGTPHYETEAAVEKILEH